MDRVWLPDNDSPGLAMSRAFGDYCIKDFGLISEPNVTQRCITNKDQFLVLATDGVWDVLSNQEVVKIVSSAPDKAKSAKLLVKHVMQAWKRKRRGIAMDDILYELQHPGQVKARLILRFHMTTQLLNSGHMMLSYVMNGNFCSVCCIKRLRKFKKKKLYALHTIS